MLGKLAGGLFLIAMLSLGTYVTFIHPDYRPNIGESVSFTRACADGSGGVSVDEAETKRLHRGLAEGDMLVLRRGSETAAIFFLASAARAQNGETELRKLIRPQVGAAGAAARVFHRDALLHVEPSLLRTLSAAATAGFARCATEVSDPHYARLAFFRTKTIAHPFRSGQ
jgi:hypothetical protein